MNLGTLQITNPDGHIQEFIIPKIVIVVGRVPGTDLMLGDTSVSRQHARMMVDRGKLSVEDLNSANGTFIDGQRLNPHTPTPVSKDQAIWFGDVVVRYFPPAVEQQTLIIDSPMASQSDATLIYTPKPQATPPVDLPPAAPPVYAPPPQYAPQPQYAAPPPVAPPPPAYQPPAPEPQPYAAQPQPQYAPPPAPAAPAGEPEKKQRSPVVMVVVVLLILLCLCITCVGGTFAACASGQALPFCASFAGLPIGSTPTVEPTATPEDTPTPAPDDFPQINEFTVTPEGEVAAGTEVTLEWSVNNVDSLTISPDPDPENEEKSRGSVTFVVTESVTYVLEATNDAGTVTQEIVITVSEGTNLYLPLVLLTAGGDTQQTP